MSNNIYQSVLFAFKTFYVVCRCFCAVIHAGIWPGTNSIQCPVGFSTGMYCGVRQKDSLSDFSQLACRIELRIGRRITPQLSSLLPLPFPDKKSVLFLDNLLTNQLADSQLAEPLIRRHHTESKSRRVRSIAYIFILWKNRYVQKFRNVALKSVFVVRFVWCQWVCLSASWIVLCVVHCDLYN